MSVEEDCQVTLHFVTSTSGHEAMPIVRVMLVRYSRANCSASPLAHAAHEREPLVAQHVESGGDNVSGRQVFERLDEKRTEFGVHQSVYHVRLEHPVAIFRLDFSPPPRSRYALFRSHNRIHLKATNFGFIRNIARCLLFYHFVICMRVDSNIEI